jgi:tetratricopeptide (TPR) repeat protein
MDPASIAFAQLAEEYRRSGRHREAIDVCRTGLSVHPGYLSARVTLARALVEVGDVASAEAEFERVLAQAPDNLVAIRGLADLHYRRGDVAGALAKYNAALALAPNDPDLEQTIRDLTSQVSKAPGPEPTRSDEEERALRTLATLDQWLTAIHAVRLDRHP